MSSARASLAAQGDPSRWVMRALTLLTVGHHQFTEMASLIRARADPVVVALRVRLRSRSSEPRRYGHRLHGLESASRQSPICRLHRHELAGQRLAPCAFDAAL